MILVFFITLALVLSIWITLNVLRKFHWDAIHFNLLDLADSMNGKVIRNGFFARPILHGSYLGTDLTVNFSSDKIGKSRKNLVDISLARNMHQSATISSLDWLKEREEKSISAYTPFEVSGQLRYGILSDEHPAFLLKLENTHLRQSIEKLHPFRFIFISRRGILFEKEVDNLPQDTRHPRLKELIDTIFEFIRNYGV